MSISIKLLIKPIVFKETPTLPSPTEDHIRLLEANSFIDSNWAKRFTPVRFFREEVFSKVHDSIENKYDICKKTDSCFATIRMIDERSSPDRSKRYWNQASYYSEPAFENSRVQRKCYMDLEIDNNILADTWESLEFLSLETTFHKKGYSAFFMPTLSEVHAQTPDALQQGGKYYFTTQPWADVDGNLFMVKEGDKTYHIASTFFFKDSGKNNIKH